VSFVTGNVMIADDVLDGKSRATIDDVVGLFTRQLERQRESDKAWLLEDHRQFFGTETGRKCGRHIDDRCGELSKGFRNKTHEEQN
jgi:hypothetical protein